MWGFIQTQEGLQESYLPSVYWCLMALAPMLCCTLKKIGPTDKTRGSWDDYWKECGIFFKNEKIWWKATTQLPTKKKCGS